MNAMDTEHAAKALPFFLRAPLLQGQSRLSSGDRVGKKTITFQEGMRLVLLSTHSHSTIIHKPISS
jgi:hypothetical protein